MENRKSAGARKYYYIDLSVARTGKAYQVRGRYIRIANASDTVANVDIAIQENVPSAYETLKKNGFIVEGNGFDRFYLANTAQAGKWLRLIVTEGPDDYDVNNPSIGTVDSVGAIDSPVEIVDDDILAALASIVSAVGILASDTAQRASLTTLEGATHVDVTNATTEVVAAVDNTDGVIIRQFFGAVYNGSNYARLLIDDNPVGVVQGGGGMIGNHIENMHIPAGVSVKIESSNASYTGTMWYEVL